MDIVTITDHDSIDGWRELMDVRPDAADILPGEEVSCRLPDGDIEVHLGVYGITERLHARDPAAARECVRRDGLPARVEHILRAESPAALLPRTGAAGNVPAAALARCRHSRRETARCWPHNLCSSVCAASGIAVSRRSRASPAATRTRCDESAGPGPKRRAQPRRNSWHRFRRAWAARAGATADRRLSRGTPTAWSARYIASVYGCGTARSSWLAPRRLRASDCRVGSRAVPAAGRGGGRQITRTAAVAAAIETLAACRGRPPRGPRCRGATVMTPRRVAITGIGMVTALGLTREENWTNLAQRHVRHGRRDRVPDRRLSQPDRRRGAVRSPHKRASPRCSGAGGPAAINSGWSRPWKRSTTAA